MPILERVISTDARGYREVSLDYRIARAQMLDLRRSGERAGRIACPGLDASRNVLVYGRNALSGGGSASLKLWADALGVNSIGIKTVAYLSGPLWSTPIAFLLGRFDDRQVNGGFLRSLKRSTNTGILTFGRFDQIGLNEFVWAVRPDMQGTAMTPDWLYGELAACQYIDESMLPSIRRYNSRNADTRASWLTRKLGIFLSNFEIRSLLLGILGQPVLADEQDTTRKLNAISLRDLHDLYKYGFFPAAAEDRLSSAGLLSFPEVSARKA